MYEIPDLGQMEGSDGRPLAFTLPFLLYPGAGAWLVCRP